MVYQPRLTTGTKMEAALEPVEPKLYLVSSAKVSPVLQAMILINTAMMLRKMLPPSVASMICLKSMPAASPPPAIILVITNTKPVHTMVRLK